MPRWKPDARERLVSAAIELFNERGFAATTIPQITARAGLTTRTFYRHFADKREVLFGPEHNPDTVQAVLDGAPQGVSLAAFVAWGLRLMAERFAPYREVMRATQALIDSDASLRERALRKREMLHAVFNEAFRSRGLGEQRSRLLAEVAVSALYLAIDEWLQTDADVGIDMLALGALRDLHSDLEDIGTVEVSA
jgi:AcrR family transcriptional regulator